MSLELKKAIEQISKDRGLDRDMLVSTLEEAVRTSVTRKYGDDLDVEVHYSDDTGDIEVFQFKFVVEEVEDPLTQISQGGGSRPHRRPVGQAGDHPAHARRRAGTHLRGIQGPRG